MFVSMSSLNYKALIQHLEYLYFVIIIILYTFLRIFRIKHITSYLSNERDNDKKIISESQE